MKQRGDLAPVMQAFFAQRLMRELGASAHTIASYRDTFRLLLAFAQEQLSSAPSSLNFADLDAPFIVSFLEHLESTRGNTTRSRNTRLAAIHSLFRFAALRAPEQSATFQRVLSIPHKRFVRRQVDFLVASEVEALINAPDVSRPGGLRDKALLMVAVETGMRVSELTSARIEDLSLSLRSGSHLRCEGKGRKERTTPLSRETAAFLRSWLRECGPSEKTAPLFPNARGAALSRDGVAHLLRKHTRVAERACPSLKGKRVTPHVLRHTAAMRLLEGGVDRAVIALWLGHESVETTQIYFHADLGMKRRVLARGPSTGGRFARYRPSDDLLAFLTNL